MFETVPLALRIESHGDGPLPIFIVFVLIAIGLAIFGYWQDKERREALHGIAMQLGFSFSPDNDHSFAGQYGFLNHMDDGSDRYAFNIMQGTARDGSPCSIFDYHYETYSTDSKGRRRTQHHYFSIFTLILPRSFPELEIKPEGLFSKLGQALGFDDIDFESMEFSKRYQVKGDDKKFAYDFCNALMIDYLLRQHDLIIEVESNVLALTFEGKLALDSIIPNHERLLQIRSLMPGYLFS